MDTYTTTTSSNTSPWSGQQPFLSFGFDQAQQNYLNNVPQYYPNQSYVNFSQPTVSALNGIQDIANQNQVGFASADEALKTLGGDYLNNNPYIDDVVNRVAGDVGSQVNSAFSSAGRYGSNAHADTLANSIADAASQMRFGNYEMERGNMLKQQALAPQADQLQYAGLNNLLNVGSTIEGKEFEALTDDMNRWNFDQNLPNTHLGNYMGLINGNYGNQSTSTQSQPLYGNSTSQNVLGGALAGYGLADSLGSGISPWLGAAAGGLFGLFS